MHWRAPVCTISGGTSAMRDCVLWDRESRIGPIRAARLGRYLYAVRASGRNASGHNASDMPCALERDKRDGTKQATQRGMTVRARNVT
eukprot:4876503-Prymnesium_polylepis.2